MKTRDSIAGAKVRAFEEVDDLSFVNRMTATQIFVSGLSNRLTVSPDMLCTIFKPIYQKFDCRRMDEIHGG